MFKLQKWNILHNDFNFVFYVETALFGCKLSHTIDLDFTYMVLYEYYCIQMWPTLHVYRLYEITYYQITPVFSNIIIQSIYRAFV